MELVFERKKEMFSNTALKHLIIPLIVEQILVMFVGMADTMMISYAGEAAISGVSLVDMINNLIICILSAVASGGAIIVSQYLGGKNQEKGNMAAGQLMMISVIVSFMLMVGCLLFHRILLSLFFGSVEVEVMEAAKIYFVISALSFPFLGIYNSTTALFRSMGKTNTTMKVSLWMNIINVIGNMIGIFIFHAGVAGVAIPTLFARGFAAVVMLSISFDKNKQITLSWHHIFAYHKDMVKRILHIAIPNGIENGLFHFGKVLVTSVVALFGTAQIAANGVANSIDMIAIIVVNAINLAIITVVGQCVGANEYDQAQFYIKKLMKIAYLTTGIFNIVVFVLLPYLLQLYTLSPEAYQYSYDLVIMHNLLAFLLHPTSFVLPNGIRAAGDVRFTMVIGIFSMIVFRLGSAVLFGIILHMGIYGVWIAMGMDWLCRSILFYLRFHRESWRNFQLI